MHAYKDGVRQHNVMQMMAGRLSNAEIAPLAGHFATIDQGQTDRGREAPATGGTGQPDHNDAGPIGAPGTRGRRPDTKLNRRAFLGAAATLSAPRVMGQGNGRPRVVLIGGFREIDSLGHSYGILAGTYGIDVLGDSAA